MGKPPMRLATFLWGSAFLAAGLLVAAGAAPGSARWAPGPRAGIATLLLVLGFGLTAGPALSRAVGRRSRQAGEGAGGNCPVGATCSCGHFNFKPRRACRACGRPTSYGGNPAAGTTADK